VRRAHPPSHVSLDRLAVMTHRSAPSSRLVKSGRYGEASTFLAEGAAATVMEQVENTFSPHSTAGCSLPAATCAGSDASPAQ